MDNENQNPKQAIVDKFKDTKNILVTVSNNPTVDQLASCLGLTLWLNKSGKHATAVFSGEVPSTLEFLQPDETLEKNTDSLRDFIISLDKSKADKLRYKVEDAVVKVFVTPYRTSLTADDLEFSQGDFNVDMVIALGVHSQDELDAAITAHGRILHDATVTTITIGNDASELGAINWHDSQASSLCELVVELANSEDKALIDEQIATALLTGVVAETERFSNDKTTPQTMSVSAQLMSAGANQQLVANKLEEPVEPFQEAAMVENSEDTEAPVDTPAADGSLSIGHEAGEEPAAELPAPVENESEPETPAEPSIEEVQPIVTDNAPEAEPEVSHFATEEPELGSPLTANTEAEDVMNEPSVDPLSQPPAADVPMLDHNAPSEQPSETQFDPAAMQPAPPNWMPPQPWMDQPVEAEQPAAEDITGLPSEPVSEPDPEAVPESPPAPEAETPDVDAARDEVLKAIQSDSPAVPEPVQALNALPIDLNAPSEQPQEALPSTDPVIPIASTEFIPADFQVMNDPEVNQQPAPFVDSSVPAVDPNLPADPELTGPVEQPFTMPLPGAPLTPPPANPLPPTSVEFDPTAPPPVPPPLPPQN